MSSSNIPDGTLIIPEDTLIINDKAYKKREFNRVEIPDTVETIGEGAFFNCKNLKYVTINTNESIFQTIEDDAFKDCSNLRTITIKGTGELFSISDSKKLSGLYIKSNAFNGCYNLKTINMPQEMLTKYLISIDTSIDYGKFLFFGAHTSSEINIKPISEATVEGIKRKRKSNKKKKKKSNKKKSIKRKQRKKKSK